jgi:DNA-binding FadR family transcriptional regulator
MPREKWSAWLTDKAQQAMPPELERITQHLSSLQLRTGERLPAERELAITLGMTRNKLRRGLEQLEADGAIWRHVGKGTFVGPPTLSVEREVPINVANAVNPHDLMEVRLIFEPRAVALAALRATPTELDEIASHFENMLSAQSVGEFEKWDGRFHRAIICAARNTVLTKISELINSVREERIWGTLKQRSSTPARRAYYSGQHRQILIALQERRSADAEEAMREHLRDVQRDLLEASSARRE